jgi:hypothetical protein
VIGEFPADAVVDVQGITMELRQAEALGLVKRDASGRYSEVSAQQSPPSEPQQAPQQAAPEKQQEAKEGDRWNYTLKRISVRRRDPYNARHSSVSWNLMVQPEKLLWIAEQHGHSVAVMLKDYAAWTKGAKDADVTAIREAMQSAPGQLLKAA